MRLYSIVSLPVLMGCAAVSIVSAWAADDLDLVVEQVAAADARSYILQERIEQLLDRYTPGHPEVEKLQRELQRVQDGVAPLLVDLAPEVREQARARSRGMLIVHLRDRLAEVDKQHADLERRYVAGDPQLDDLRFRRELIELEITRLETAGIVTRLPPSRSRTGSSAPGGPQAGDKPDALADLEALKDRLRLLKLRYTDLHPRVVELKQRIATTEEHLRTTRGGTDEAGDRRLMHMRQAEHHLRQAGFGTLADLVRDGALEVEKTRSSPLLESLGRLRAEVARLRAELRRLQARPAPAPSGGRPGRSTRWWSRRSDTGFPACRALRRFAARRCSRARRRAVRPHTPALLTAALSTTSWSRRYTPRRRCVGST